MSASTDPSIRLPADDHLPVDLPRGLRARLDPAQRFGLRLTLLGLALALVTIPFTILLLEVLAKGPLVRLDGRIANTMNDWVHGHVGLVPTFEAISLLGRPPFLALWVVVVAVGMCRTGRRRITWFVIATSLGGGIVDSLVKLAVKRPRPVLHHPVAVAFGKSFPSGHAMSSTVAYGAILVALWPVLPINRRRPALVGTVVLVLLVGTSRLLLGVHFLSDVVGGFVLGGAWLAGSVAAFETWNVEARRAELKEAARERGSPWGRRRATRSSPGARGSVGPTGA